MKFPDLLLVLTILFLRIDLSRPQLTPEGGDVLQLFRFYRGATISLMIYQHKSVRITDGGRTTCANLCIDETSFTCRSFAFYQNPSTLDTECTWADGSPNTDGRLAFIQADQSRDLYMRIQNECDSFLVETLPAKCPTPLGMKRGLLTDFRGYAAASDLADDQIVASSSAEEQFHPRNSRLDGPSCWKNTNRDLHPWIQVNLVQRHIVTGLVVQGCGRDFLGWIQQFKVESKTNGNPFVEHVDRATGSEVIEGNTEPRCGKLVTFDPWLYADAIRIKPIQWYRSIGLRFEILGCKDDCDYSMGLTDGELEDAAITASSVYNVESSPKEARIQPLGIQSISTVGWKPGPGQTEWIQVRFPELREIRAVTTQGCSQSFPKNFLLTYSTSTDSTNWKHFNYPNTNHPLDFVANSDDTTLMRHNLPYEFLALLVRITPTGWGGVGRCFKFELVGCVHQDCNEQLNIGNNGGAIQAQGALTCSPQSFSIHGDSSSNLQNTAIAFPATIQASLMITLIGEYTITGIISQGSINDREYGPTWANKYTLQYARDVNDGDSHGFRNYLEPDGSIQVFSANFDSVTPVTNHLVRPIAATRLQVTYYNDDVIYPKVPCIRLDFLGCAVSEYGHICGSSAAEVDGYCMATIANSDPGSCSSVFHATSYPAIVKSSSFSSLISDVLKSISPPGYDMFHIGLRQKQERTGGEGSLYEWVDGTPLLYNQFDPSYIPHDQPNVCPSISIHDRTYWETPACNTPSQVVGTLCQFDLDECAQSTSGCSHGCLNYPGGFTCQCSRGMYLDSENIKECKPVCNFRDMESLLEVFPDSCFKFHTTVATFDNAVETCNQTNGSLVGPDHYFYLVSKEWEPWNSPPSFIWRQGTPYKQHPDGPLLCNVGLINTAPPPESRIILSVRPCDHQYQFICVYDAPFRYVLEPSEHNQTTALKAEASYISWVGIPPWFDQLKTAFLDILVTNGLIIKFKMLSVNLRVNGQDTCLDKLLITEHLGSVNDTYHRPLCGNLPEFDILTKTNHVGISLQIGRLTEWNTELSVKFYYDTHDCSLTECDYTCPTEDSPITESNGVLMSWRHPWILPPAYSCRWTIISKPNVYVRLDFFTVSVEAHYPIKVFARRLNGSQLDETSYVTVTSPVWIMSETTKVIITYETGLMHKANGFRVHHGPTAGAVEAPGCEFLPKDVKSSCPKTECNLPKAYLASPNFPNLYSLNECQYVITTSPGSYVWFLPREVYFEGDASCRGKLELWDSRAGYVICSRTNFQPFSAKGNVLTVAYKPSSLPGKFYGVYEERYFETPNYDHITEKDLDFTCPPNWRLFNGRCFFVANHPENLRWNEALSECRSIGNASSELASISNTAEMNFVQGLLVKDELGSTIYYIGLTMNLQSSAARYEWVDGLPVSYTDWYISPFVFSDKQPDGGTAEACTAIDIRDFTSTKNWVDVPCADPLTDNFICAQQAAFKGSEEVSRPAITFHTEECGANFVRVGSQCLLMVPKHPDPNNTNLCQDDTIIVGRSFVENNLERMRNYHENVWYLPGWRYVMVDQPYSHKLDSAPCYRVWDQDIVDCDIGSAYVLCATEMSVMYQTCKGDQFPCSSGECISSSFVNDLKPDCRDGSDEMTSLEELSHEDIRTRNCLNPSFLRCGDNRCIPGYLFCDFKEDCFDGSDERNCVFPSCAENEFTCNSGECIPHNKTCDLLMDCLDGSDETECDGYTTDSVFQCYSGRTLPSYLYCDGYRDCSGKIFEDEPQNCDYLDNNFVCDEFNQITCDNKACTDRTNVCMMADDEYGYTSGCRDVRHLKNCDLFECTNFTFKCPQSYCIPQHYRCNGRADCPGREDEEYCETYNCEGAYRCHRSIICLSQHHVCDGIKHCPEGDDELFCDQSCPSGCLCVGSSYNCTDMEWDRHAAELVPYDVKQLYLSFLKKRQRVTRTINTDMNISISIATLIDVHDFPFLIYLDLSGNGINFIANGTFVSNPNLRVLNMSNNNLSFINSGTFFGLDKLRILDLRGNKNLSDALWSPFQHFQVLKELYLQNTTIVTSDPEIIRGLDVIRIFQSDRFYYCCLLDEHEYLEECLPKQGDFSSCTSLIRNQALRIGMWILGMAALCGNLAVITWRLACQIVLRRQQRNPVQTFLVLNLAVADLFMGFYMLLIASADVYFRDTYALYSDQWQTSFFCRFAGFLSTLSSVSSVMFLTVISVDRCQHVAFPFSRRHLRRQSAYVVACCVWAVVMFIGILPAVVYGGAYYGRSSVCLALPITEQRLDGWAFSFAVFIILTLLLFFVIVSCYVGIFIVAHKSSKTSRNVSMSDQQHKREQLQMAAKVAFLVGTDFACWVPIIIMGFLSLNANAVSGDLYAVTAVFILPVNSALNPYLYTFLVERASALAKKKSTLQTTSTRDSEPAQDNPLVHREATRSEQDTTVVNSDSEVVKTALASLRTTRIIGPLSSDKFKKNSLSEYMLKSNFTLEETEKEDIIRDLSKALEQLHNLGLPHGDVNENHVIIDESSYGNKRAFLLMTSNRPVQGSHAKSGTEEDKFHQDLMQLRDLGARLNNMLSSVDKDQAV